MKGISLRILICENENERAMKVVKIVFNDKVTVLEFKCCSEVVNINITFKYQCTEALDSTSMSRILVVSNERIMYNSFHDK